VEGVAAGPGDGVDDAAGGAAILRRIVRGVDLELLDADWRNREGSAGAAAGLRVVGLVVVGAVDGVVVQQKLMPRKLSRPKP
jgi:hypothetical protein